VVSDGLGSCSTLCLVAFDGRWYGVLTPYGFPFGAGHSALCCTLDLLDVSLGPVVAMALEPLPMALGNVDFLAFDPSLVCAVIAFVARGDALDHGPACVSSRQQSWFKGRVSPQMLAMKTRFLTMHQRRLDYRLVAQVLPSCCLHCEASCSG
jgi:hypothetical protein